MHFANMHLKGRLLALCFTCIFFHIQQAHPFSLREGKHKNFTRLVLENPKGLQLLSAKNSHAKKISLLLSGPICTTLKKKSKVTSRVVKTWSINLASQNQCPIDLSLYKPLHLKRAFILKKPQRLVLDLSATTEPAAKTMRTATIRPSTMPSTTPSVKPLANIILKGQRSTTTSPTKSTMQKASNPVLKRLPEISFDFLDFEPPEKPTTHLFHPFLLEKPFRPNIVIDAGHGGHDPGSISCRGNYEKNVTLKAAKNIAVELKKAGRYHVVLTRKRDIFVPKRKRFAIAREAKADFLISIHADNHPSKKLRGLTIYTLSAKASDKEADRLSKQENKSEFLEDLDFTANVTRDVSNVLIDIAQRASKNTALILAETFHKCLLEKKVGKLMTLRSADLAVLKAPDTPSILVELGFLSNVKDEKLVRTVQYQKKLAQALINALDKYFKKA